MGKTRLGLTGKVYLSTEGTFNAIKVARDQITLNLSKSEADVTPHGSEWELFRGAVKAAEVSFQMLDKTDDTVVAAILDSFLNGTPLELKVLNGAEDAEGVSGLHAAFEVFQCNRPSGNKDASYYDVTLKPTESDDDTLPKWVTVEAAGP